MYTETDKTTGDGRQTGVVAGVWCWRRAYFAPRAYHSQAAALLSVSFISFYFPIAWDIFGSCIAWQALGVCLSLLPPLPLLLTALSVYSSCQTFTSGLWDSQITHPMGWTFLIFEISLLWFSMCCPCCASSMFFHAPKSVMPFLVPFNSLWML